MSSAPSPWYEPVWAFLRRFWYLLAALFTGAGSYLVISEKGLGWVVAIAVAALVAALTPSAVRVWQRNRRYDALLNATADAEQQRDVAQAEARRVAVEAEAAMAGATEEGRQQVIGAICGHLMARDPLRISAFVNEGDTTALVVETSSEELFLGARFQVLSRASGLVKGIVETVEFDRDAGRAILRCVDPVVPEFWSRAAQQASLNDQAPPGLDLIPVPVEGLPESVLERLAEETTINPSEGEAQ